MQQHRSRLAQQCAGQIEQKHGNPVDQEAPEPVPGPSKDPFSVEVLADDTYFQFGENQPVAVPSGTPVKKFTGIKTPMWSDLMKLELLREWILKAGDPLVLADTPTGKGCYIKQLKIMMSEGCGIRLDGDVQKTRLDSLVTSQNGADTLAQILQGVKGKGLSGQGKKKSGEGGLVHIIHEWLLTETTRTKEHVKKSVEEILTFARHKYSQDCV